MGKTFSIITPLFLALILTGCYTASPPTNPKLLSDEARNTSASAEIKKFNDSKNSTPPPPMMLPSVYQNISPLSGKTISLSAENANLRQVLYLISQNSGLNLVIDGDVDTNATITLTLNKASTEDALDTAMELSGCSYTLKGNMLYIRQYSTRTFAIPYIHTQSSFDSTLGGDLLGSAGSSTGISGKFALNYKNPLEANDFYKQLEVNIKESITPNGKFTLNKFTGTLIVTDTKKSLDAIEDMLKKIKKSASRQVLIEAKILEVNLNDTHQLGVDWSTLPGAIGDFAFSQTLGLTGATAGKLSYSDKHITAVISALDTAGDVQTLSNPRIKVSSGQSALITSGKLVPFWDLEVTPGTTINGVTTPALYEYTRRDVLDGISLGVTPKITEDGQIILNIVPVSTSIESEKTLEGFTRTGDGGSTTGTVATAPIINIKEAGTIIYAKDNDLVLIGGLINNVKKDSRESVPVLGGIPYFGALFSRTDTKDEKRELVILLKLNLVEQ
jgi:MSHA biogenesis protein MshL